MINAIPILLTPENYHGNEASRAYWSWSQFSSWLECPARTHAKIYRGWIDPDEDSEALVYGSYVDVALLTPERLAAHKAKNSDKLNSAKTGKPYAFVLHADQAVERVRKSPGFMNVIRGDGITNQVIIPFQWLGVWWKVMIDALDTMDPANPVFITDLKTTKSITKLEWCDRRRKHLPFYEIWNYWGQLALYRHAVRIDRGAEVNNLMIAAISKEKYIDHAVIRFNNAERFAAEIANIERAMDELAEYKDPTYAGDFQGQYARPCGECAYCLETKIVETYVEAISIGE
jgi:hypothetical protein